MLRRCLSSLSPALLLMSCFAMGCQSASTRQVSELAGAWALKKGYLVTIYSETKAESDFCELIPSEEQEEFAYAVFGNDGAFESFLRSLSMMLPGVQGLKHDGDRVKFRDPDGAWQLDVEVAQAKYSTKSSFVLLRFTPSCEIESMSAEARLLANGTVLLRTAIVTRDCERFLTAILEPFEGDSGSS